MPTSTPQSALSEITAKGGYPPNLRMIYRPADWSVRASSASAGTGTVRDRIRRPVTAGIAYYRDRLSLPIVVITAIVMCYGGGLVLFWFHSIALNKGGPAIAWYTHWLIDSTLAFVALGPVLVVILPLATWTAARLTMARGTGDPHPSRLTMIWYVIAGGVMFAAVTTPGPLVHDVLVGHDTAMATRLTDWFGDPARELPHFEHYSVLSQLSQQWGAGLVVYPVLMALTVLVIRTGLATLARLGGAGGKPHHDD